MYFHIPRLGMEITHSLLLEWLPLKWGAAGLPCSRVQLGCHAAVTRASCIQTAGLPCSCHQSLMHINSWAAMQLLLGNHAYKTAGLPCSCHQSIMHINSRVAMQLSPKHHAYKQLGCHAAVTRASCI